MTSSTCTSNRFEESVENHCRDSLQDFKRISRFHTLFHFTFLTITIFELIGFLLFFSFFTRSSMLAFSLAGLFLTGFSYFVLHFYFQAKRPEQFTQIKNIFIESCEKTIQFPKGTSEFYIALAHGINQFANLLENQEFYFYSMPRPLDVLNPVLQKFSCWSHWKDLHEMKEKLLFVVIEQRVERIKLEPTELESHASLAEAYLHLARLYCDPRKLNPEEFFPWVSPEYGSELMERKFQKASARAIEEYKILDSYAPGSSWTYAQLASVYRDLDLREEEIACYEKMLEITPDDHQVLFRLGTLYFQQGLNAKGLKIYETLRHTAKAEELLSYYNAFSIEEF